MSDAGIGTELEAIKTITKALEPLESSARARVLEYSIGHLGIEFAKVQTQPPHPPVIPNPPPPPVADIRTLKEAKNPTTDIEMATLVAYYLKHDAPDQERKDDIGAEDIEKYFVQGGYRLPSVPRFTLRNAKAAGYFESAGHGRYKLSAVGHNLVAHTMPRAEATSGPPKRKPRRAPAKKKRSKKESSTKPS